MAYSLKPLWVVVGGIAIMLGGTYYMNSKWEARYDEQQAQSKLLAELVQQKEDAARESKAKADSSDKLVDELSARVEAKVGENVRLKQELAVLKKGYTPLPGSNDPRDGIITKQDELIASLEEESKQKGDVILQLQVSRDNWRETALSFESALEVEKRRTASERLAKEALLSAKKANRWLGRAEGFAAGILVGYAKGRM